MGNDTSSQASLLFAECSSSEIVPIDKRDIPPEWKQTGMQFFYFIDTRIATLQDTIRKLILYTGNKIRPSENLQTVQVELFTNTPSGQPICEGITIFRVVLAEKYSLGIIRQFDISPTSFSSTFSEYANKESDQHSSVLESAFDPQEPKIPELSENPNTEQSESRNEPEIQKIEHEPKLTEDSSKSSTTKQVLTNGITYTVFGLDFDEFRSLQTICKLLFEKATNQEWENDDQPEPESSFGIPNVFSRLGKISELGKDLGNFGKDLKRGKIGKLDLTQGLRILRRDSPSAEEDDEDFPLPREMLDSLRERDRYFGVEASLLANVFGYLENPWPIIIPTTPVLVKSDLKHLLDDWQLYCQRNQVKYKWLQLVTLPKYISISPSMREQDLQFVPLSSQANLLPYCLEFWNKPELNHRWKLNLRPTEDVVPFWKTRVYFDRDAETGIVHVFKMFSVPIWHVVDEDAVIQLINMPTTTLYQTIIRTLTNEYPNHNAFQMERREPNLEGLPSHRNLSRLSPNVQTELFHAILRQHGVHPDLEAIFSDLQISCLEIPERFQVYSTRADSKAESLVVTLGGVGKHFVSMNLSRCTLSSESLHHLSPFLVNLMELNLSYCSGIFEWGFLLNFTSQLRQFNCSNLKECSQGQQLCAMISGLQQLQIIDLSFTKLNLSDLCFHLSKLNSLTSLNLDHNPGDSQWSMHDEGLSTLLQISTLRSLYLPGGSLTPTGIYRLVELPHLTELGFSNLIGLAKHSPLAGLTKLTSLSIVKSELDDYSVEGVLGVLTNITRLNLSDNYLTGDGVQTLGANMPNLRSLNIARNEVGLNRNTDHYCFAQMQNLTDLNISGNPVVTMRPWLTRRQALSHLEFLRELPNLTSLSISNRNFDNGIEDGGLSYLNNLPNLTRLSLKRHSLTDKCFSYLRKLSTLRYLNVSNNKISNTGLRDVLHLENLETICLKNTMISDSALTYLLQLPRLKKLYIRNTRVSEKALGVLGTNFPHVSVFTSF